MSARYTEAAVQVSCQVSWFKLKELEWKIRSTKVDAGDFKHELLNRLRSTMAVTVLRWRQHIPLKFHQPLTQQYNIKFQEPRILEYKTVKKLKLTKMKHHISFQIHFFHMEYGLKFIDSYRDWSA